MTAYPCARCDATYEITANRRTTVYCPSCRVRRRIERQTERNRERQRRRDDVTAVLNDYTRQGMSEDYVDMMRGRLDAQFEDVGRVDSLDGFADARPLESGNSPAGPEDGTSTRYTDLAGDLDRAHDAVAAHPWWAANPNWFVGMHNDEPIPDTIRLKAS